MKKILLIATVSGFVQQFEMDNVKLLQSLGYEVHYASNYKNILYGNSNEGLINAGIVEKHFNFKRSPWALSNLLEIWKVKRLIQDEQYNLVYCYTPMGGVIGRLAGFLAGSKNVLYVAYGFYFWEGAPIIRSLLFYWIEKYLARITNFILTVNSEDYLAACKFNLKNNGKVFYIPGPGIDYSSISEVAVKKKCVRTEFNIQDDDYLFITCGELTDRKNHEVLIHTFSNLKHEKIKLMICGDGPLYYKLDNLIKSKKLEDKVFLLGYRKDLIRLLKCADAFILPSISEGLSVALMKAMACGLPVICSKIRGNVDLIENSKGGFLCSPNDVDAYCKCIKRIIADRTMSKNMGEVNAEKIKDLCSIEHVNIKMQDMYREILNEKN